MFVRIARFEGGGPEGADRTVEEIRRQLQSGAAPEGLEGARRVQVLVDRRSGRHLGLTYFETEEDLRRGDEALNAMTPGGGEQRTAVETYEVALDEQRG